MEVGHSTGCIAGKSSLIYYPIAKSGCTSLKNLLLRQANAFVDDSTFSEHTGGHFEYVRWVPGLEYSEYIKFAVVRNPWDRLVSCFFDKIVRQGEENFQSGINKVGPAFERYNRLLRMKLFRNGMSFAEFVDLVSKIPDFASDMHFRSQYTYVFSWNKLIPDMRLIKLENLDKELELIDKYLASFYLSEGAKKNVSMRKPYQDYYDERLVKSVYRRYKLSTL